MITRTIRKKPNQRSKADRRPSPDDSMTGQRELGTTSQTVGPESCRLSTFKPLVISTYNVRTLHQQGKTHQLFMVCSDVGIDIIGIQEHRLITKEPTEELWSDDNNWVLVYSSATEIPPSEASSLDMDASIRINTPVRPHSHQQLVEKFTSEL